MKHVMILLSAFLVFFSTSATSQTTLDALQNDLNNFKQQRQVTNDQSLNNFLQQVNAAAQDKSTARQLYLVATGQAPSADPNAPAPAPSIIDYAADEDTSPSLAKPKHHHAYEDSPNYPTLDERQAQEQSKQADTEAFSNMVQAHCALLHFAALFTCKADRPGLQQEFLNWLNALGPTYPQLGHSLLGHVTMQDSPISKYLTFTLWNGSDQSQWSIRSVPKLYREQVVQSLSMSHNPQVLNAWDIYIAMRQSDSRDQDRWTNETYPGLLFERACEDYNLSPNMIKLGNLIAILKTCPNHPQMNDMMAKVNQMLSDYRANQASSAPGTISPPSPAPTPP